MRRGGRCPGWCWGELQWVADTSEGTLLSWIFCQPQRCTLPFTSLFVNWALQGSDSIIMYSKVWAGEQPRPESKAILLSQHQVWKRLEKYPRKERWPLSKTTKARQSMKSRQNCYLTLSLSPSLLQRECCKSSADVSALGLAGFPGRGCSRLLQSLRVRPGNTTPDQLGTGTSLPARVGAALPTREIRCFPLLHIKESKVWLFKAFLYKLWKTPTCSQLFVFKTV